MISLVNYISENNLLSLNNYIKEGVYEDQSVFILTGLYNHLKLENFSDWIESFEKSMKYIFSAKVCPKLNQKGVYIGFAEDEAVLTFDTDHNILYVIDDDKKVKKTNLKDFNENDEYDKLYFLKKEVGEKWLKLLQQKNK